MFLHLKMKQNFLELVKIELLKIESYYPTQNAISAPIIYRICKKIDLGILVEPIKINNSEIIDGHHRFIASQLMKTKINVVPYQRPNNTVSLQWKNIRVDTKDWDSKAQLYYFTKRDAKILSISDIELLKLME